MQPFEAAAEANTALGAEQEQSVSLTCPARNLASASASAAFTTWIFCASAFSTAATLQAASLPVGTQRDTDQQVR